MSVSDGPCWAVITIIGDTMEYERALASAMSGKAILFVGAGFSRGAIAVTGDSLPDGRGLARLLCSDADALVTDDLKVATNRYLRKKVPMT